VGVPLPTGLKFLSFKVKLQGFMHFIAKKLWPETGTGGLNLIDPLGRGLKM